MSTGEISHLFTVEEVAARFRVSRRTLQAHIRHPILIQPRLLLLKEAASYCGISIPTFGAVCPVRPISLGKGKRLERYDIRLLDKWIDALGSKDTSLRKDWLTAWDENHDGRAGEGS